VIESAFVGLCGGGQGHDKDMGEAKRRRQVAGSTSENNPPDRRGGIKVDDQLLTRIATLSRPHVEAVVIALIKAFPDNNEHPKS
jgi:hypothetical protein